MKFYSKLAIENIKRRLEIYIPYSIVSIILIVLSFLIANLSYSKVLVEAKEYFLLKILFMATIVLLILISFIMISYLNLYIFRVRTKELGLYNVLGMSKREIAKLLFVENIITTTIIILFSLLFSFLLNKLNFLIVGKIFLLKEGLNIDISFNIVRKILLIYIIQFLLIYLVNISIIAKRGTIELLKLKEQEEKESKTNPVLAILGIGLFVWSLFILVRVGVGKFEKNFLTQLIFGVMVLVVGVYLLFTNSFVWIIKLLKNNKSFYYKRSNFISVSNLIYRVKKNALGLASICLISCMVIVILASTIALYRYSHGLKNTVSDTDIITATQSGDVVGGGRSYSISSKGNIMYESISDRERDKSLSEYLNESAKKHRIELIKQKDLQVIVSEIYNSNIVKDNLINIIYNDSDIGNKINYKLNIYKLSDYNKYNNKDEILDDREILTYETDIFKKTYGDRNTFLEIDGKKFNTKKYLLEKPMKIYYKNYDGISIVVNDSEFEKIYEIMERTSQEKEKNSEKQQFMFNKYNVEYYNINASSESTEKFLESVDNLNLDSTSDLSYDGITERYQINLVGQNRDTQVIRYQIFMFLGVYLSVALIVLVMVIIYFKQISEGYEDRKQYQILKKLGLSEEEIKRNVNEQIRIIFSLPLVITIITSLLLGLAIKSFFLGAGTSWMDYYFTSVLISLIIFTLIYFIIYKQTSTKYYQIVKRKDSIFDNLKKR